MDSEVLISNQLNMILNQMNSCQAEIVETIEKEVDRVLGKIKILEILLSISLILQIILAIVMLMTMLLHPAAGGSAAVASGASVASGQNAMIINTGK